MPRPRATKNKAFLAIISEVNNCPDWPIFVAQFTLANQKELQESVLPELVIYAQLQIFALELHIN